MLKALFTSLIALSALAAQTPANQPKFEVASVKVSSCLTGGASIDPASVTLRGTPLKLLLREAFKIPAERIEGPSWLERGCFDIVAKIPEGATSDQLPAMYRALLTERFKLASHTEDRQLHGYSLVVDKGGPKVKQDDPKAEFMGVGRAGMFGIGRAGRGGIKRVGTMAQLAAYLSTTGYGPVEDLTGLTGNYDIDLHWVGAAPLNADSPDAPEAELFTAIREQLGLKLERQNVRAQFLVVDHIERIPTDN